MTGRFPQAMAATEMSVLRCTSFFRVCTHGPRTHPASLPPAEVLGLPTIRDTISIYQIQSTGSPGVLTGTGMVGISRGAIERSSVADFLTLFTRGSR